LAADEWNDTRTEPDVSVAARGTTVTAVGADGAPTIAAAEGDEVAPVPRAFVAVAVQRYRFPVVSPDTTIGVVDPVADPGVPPSFDLHAIA
jgi:hypothetical protein